MICINVSSPIDGEWNFIIIFFLFKYYSIVLTATHLGYTTGTDITHLTQLDHIAFLHRHAIIQKEYMNKISVNGKFSFS